VIKRENRVPEAIFLSGVVEGFYGRQWSHVQRLHLFGQMTELGLNTYFYAPKDDLKHRSIWRECYTNAELALFLELSESCNRQQLNFIYGLSPGLDIRFSEESERELIEKRFEQMMKAGVRHFALLFDDLPGQMRDSDRRTFDSLATAQCDVTNSVFAWVRERSDDCRFLFCPTPYCDRMDRACLGGSGYLDEVGGQLAPEIDVLWTGPEIVSPEIPMGSIECLSRRIRRPPIIWDNLFANDYDIRRLHCGPYAGRQLDLRLSVRGILINPNNEFPINEIPLRTFSQFLKSTNDWNPREAYLSAASEWLAKFETIRQPLSLDDLVLLADCFYLPHINGPVAEGLLALVDRLNTIAVDEWGGDFEKFCCLNSRIQNSFDRLTELRDRELFDAWSRCAWQLKEEMQRIAMRLDQKKAGDKGSAGDAIDHQLPEPLHGEILAKLERMQPTAVNR
jgi:protein O-GlcNAcase / histone acetyltransferase